MLRKRYIAYLSANKDRVFKESYMIALGVKAGHPRLEAETALNILSLHEYVLRECWDGEETTYAWVEGQVEFNRKVDALKSKK